MDKLDNKQALNKTAHIWESSPRTDDVQSGEAIDFAGLLLSDAVFKGLKQSGFDRPSPIQLKAIPFGRCGFDLVVQAKSGTGKTCVFAVVALESIDVTCSSIQVLVLAPTREIAVQIQEVINAVGCHMTELQCCTFIGGLPVADDIARMKKCHIAVGTPGRIKQLIDGNAFNPESVRLFVLDEADKLMEQGFQDDVNWIYSTLPTNKQMIAVSATYPESLADHITRYMRNPMFVRLNAVDPALLGVHQYYQVLPYQLLVHKLFEAKCAALADLLSSVDFHQCLVFSNFQMRAQSLCEKLIASGWPATCISGAQDQRDRLMAINKLKKFQCRVLISTDLTARGIDAENVNLIVNLDIPHDHETYLHRVGRAGRFGTFGAAVTLVNGEQEFRLLQQIEQLCNTRILPLPDPVPVELARSYTGVAESVITTDQLFTELAESSMSASTSVHRLSAGLSREAVENRENVGLVSGSGRSSAAVESFDAAAPTACLVTDQCATTDEIESLSVETSPCICSLSSNAEEALTVTRGDVCQLWTDSIPALNRFSSLQSFEDIVADHNSFVQEREAVDVEALQRTQVGTSSSEPLLGRNLASASDDSLWRSIQHFLSCTDQQFFDRYPNCAVLLRGGDSTVPANTSLVAEKIMPTSPESVSNTVVDETLHNEGKDMDVVAPTTSPTLVSRIHYSKEELLKYRLTTTRLAAEVKARIEEVQLQKTEIGERGSGSKKSYKKTIEKGGDLVIRQVACSATGSDENSVEKGDTSRSVSQATSVIVDDADVTSDVIVKPADNEARSVLDSCLKSVVSDEGAFTGQRCRDGGTTSDKASTGLMQQSTGNRQSSAEQKDVVVSVPAFETAKTETASLHIDENLSRNADVDQCVQYTNTDEEQVESESSVHIHLPTTKAAAAARQKSSKSAHGLRNKLTINQHKFDKEVLLAYRAASSDKRFAVVNTSNVCSMTAQMHETGPASGSIAAMGKYELESRGQTEKGDPEFCTSVKHEISGEHDQSGTRRTKLDAGAYGPCRRTENTGQGQFNSETSRRKEKLSKGRRREQAHKRQSVSESSQQDWQQNCWDFYQRMLEHYCSARHAGWPSNYDWYGYSPYNSAHGYDVAGYYSYLQGMHDACSHLAYSFDPSSSNVNNLWYQQITYIRETSRAYVDLSKQQSKL